ncbi:MFS transporter [Megasphaera hexanoica]|uniref:MFS transporter n=1 Tax=Megasphaera hexanoica TaxID=1675036 RepID=A0ABW7DLH6_9FIRM|nr:MFS transporter [Megasphaera hexanoica]AXB82831.1 MFS transporter [Megasphaera hexanoica]MCI5531252.1 MFS transporter [Caecibacter massiliensis]
MSGSVSTSSGRANLIEAIMFCTYALFAVNWIAGTTLTPEIMKYFHLDSFMSATFISNAITVAKIIGNFCAAAILIKFLPKKAIAIGSGMIVFGSALAILAPQYWVFIIGRFIMGFGGAVYVVYFSPVVIHYFKPETRPTVNAINSVAYNVGGMLAMMVVGPVIAMMQTWQMSMAFFAAISGVLFILWLFVGQDFAINTTNNSNEASTESYSFATALSHKFNWIYPATYSGILTFYIVLLCIFPISGTTVIDSKTLSIVVAFGGIVGTIITILLSKVYYKRLPVIRLCGFLLTAFGILMFTTENGVIALIAAFAIGNLMFIPVTSLFMIPQELPDMTPVKLTKIMGIFWAIAYIIETIVFFIIGAIIDSSGYTAGLTVAVVFSATAFIGSFLLPETGKSRSKK